MLHVARIKHHEAQHNAVFEFTPPASNGISHFTNYRHNGVADVASCLFTVSECYGLKEWSVKRFDRTVQWRNVSHLRDFRESMQTSVFIRILSSSYRIYDIIFYYGYFICYSYCCAKEMKSASSWFRSNGRWHTSTFIFILQIRYVFPVASIDAFYIYTLREHITNSIFDSDIPAF